MTIEGTNLAGAEWVEFGTKKVEASEFLAESATEIELESPERAAGTVDVTVTTPEGTSATSAADEYTFVAPPAVTGVSPASGPTAGGTTVTITGLRLGGASKVTFGEAEAAIVSDSASQIVATAPAHGAGAVDVRVTTIGGTSGKFAADEYTYVAPQSLTVGTAGTGSGSVSCNGGACAPSYPYGSSLTLTAAPASGSSFVGWSGAGCSGTGSCTVTITGATTVTATFDANPVPPVETVQPAKQGTAKAQSNTAQVQGKWASIKLTCNKAGPCKGTLKLYAKLPQGKHGKKTKQIGKAGY